MPWEKQFDVQKSLTRAMHAFWARGYEATSMQDLVIATGVNRASLYATYGDKRALFLAALKKYDGEFRSQTLREFASLDAPEQAIRGLFDMFINQIAVPANNWGCFLVNTALELAAHDGEIAELVNKAQDQIETFLLVMIRKGQAKGDFDPRHNATLLAHHALASLLGLLVMIRSRPERKYLEAVKESVIRSLS